MGHMKNNRKFIKSILLATTALPISLFAGNAQAIPFCSTTHTPNSNGGYNETVNTAQTGTCYLGTNDALTVETPTGSISSTGDGIAPISTGISINNAGIVTTTSNTGLHAAINNTGSVTTLTNSGTVDGLSDTGLRNATNSTIDIINNSGTISSNVNSAILTYGTIANINNDTSGVIRSTDGEAISIYDGTVGTITNKGLISSTNSWAIDNDTAGGVSLNKLVNSGTISAANGVAIGLVTSAGTIENDVGGLITAGDDAIQVQNGQTLDILTNAGTITSTGSSSDATILNQGTITSITNTGTLNTTGLGPIILNDGGTITGLTNSGNMVNMNNAAIINNAASTITTIHNTGNGLIQGASGYGIFSQGTIGSITNDANATISSDEYTIWSTGSGTINTISNAGHINGYYTITNDGTSTINTITNSGTINGDTNGATAIYNGATIHNITNTGYITGTNGGMAFDNRNGTIGTITNSGIISGSGADGIYNETNGSVINNIINYGAISSDTVYAIENAGTIGTLTNNGLITSSGMNGSAINNYGTLNLINSGTISVTGSSGSAAIYVGGTMQLSNRGTISATDGTAIEFDAGSPAAVVNDGGLITSASTGNGTINIAADVGSFSIQDGTISNTSHSNSAVDVNITHAQSDLITISHANLIADGDTAGSGHGIAVNIAAGGGNVSVDLASDNVRGSVIDTANDTVTLLTDSNIKGNITTGSGNDTLGILGGTIQGNIDLGGGINEIDINGNFTTHGTITSTGGNTDLLIDSNKSLTLNGNANLGTGGLRLNSGSSLNLTGGDINSTGTLVSGGTVEIGSTHSLNMGSIAAGNHGTFIYDVASNSGTLTSGSLNFSSGAANLTNQTIKVNSISSGTINSGTRSLIASGVGAATLPSSATVADNSYLYDFSLVQGTGGADNNIYLQASQAVSLANAAETQNNRNASNILLSNLGASSNSTIQQLQNNLNNAPTRSAYNRVIESTLPTIDNGAPASAAAFTNQAFDVTDSQLVDINTASSGTSSGDGALTGLHFWTQGFGQHSNQGSENGIAGYDANIFGGAIGADTRNFGSNNVVGLSFAYGRSHINSHNANNTDTDVDTYQLTAYANHSLSSDYFIAGMAAFGWDHNNSTRYDVGGISGLDANADYSSWQGAGRAEFGRNFHVKALGNAVLTPIVSADYVHYDSGSYSETGAGGANLHVDNASEDSLNLGIGVRAEWNFKTASNWQVKPDIHASYQYDVLHNDSIDTTSSFAAGGGTFSTNGLNPSNSTFDVGAGVKLYSTNNWDFAASYDYTARTDYNANSGLLRAAYHF